jgi:hypothetical protein
MVFLFVKVSKARDDSAEQRDVSFENIIVPP